MSIHEITIRDKRGNVKEVISEKDALGLYNKGITEILENEYIYNKMEAKTRPIGKRKQYKAKVGNFNCCVCGSNQASYSKVRIRCNRNDCVEAVDNMTEEDKIEITNKFRKLYYNAPPLAPITDNRRRRQQEAPSGAAAKKLLTGRKR